MEKEPSSSIVLEDYLSTTAQLKRQSSRISIKLGTRHGKSPLKFDRAPIDKLLETYPILRFTQGLAINMSPENFAKLLVRTCRPELHDILLQAIVNPCSEHELLILHHATQQLEIEGNKNYDWLQLNPKRVSTLLIKHFLIQQTDLCKRNFEMLFVPNSNDQSASTGYSRSQIGEGYGAVKNFIEERVRDKKQKHNTIETLTLAFVSLVKKHLSDKTPAYLSQYEMSEFNAFIKVMFNTMFFRTTMQLASHNFKSDKNEKIFAWPRLILNLLHHSRQTVMRNIAKKNATDKKHSPYEVRKALVCYALRTFIDTALHSDAFKTIGFKKRNPFLSKNPRYIYYPKDCRDY